MEWISDKGPDDIKLLIKPIADMIGIDVEIYRDDIDRDQHPTRTADARCARSCVRQYGRADVGSANGSIAAGWAVNHANIEAAESAALNECMHNSGSSDAAKTACKIVTTFHAGCDVVRHQYLNDY